MKMIPLPKFPKQTALQQVLKTRYKIVGIPVFYGRILLFWFIEHFFFLLLILVISSFYFKSPKNPEIECVSGLESQGQVCEKGKKYSSSQFLNKELKHGK